jgi:molybdopterin-binding protein
VPATKSARDEMELQETSGVTALVKASAIHLLQR